MGVGRGVGRRASEMGRPIAAGESIRERATGASTARLRRSAGCRKVRPMEFRVLGTIEVAGPLAGPSPPGAKERAILARLLLDPGRTVPADALLEAAWEGVPREVAARSLAVRVANLRAFLEPGRDRGAPVLAARARRRRLPARGRARAGRRAALRALRAHGRAGCPPPPRWSCSTARWRCGAGRRSASSPTPSSRAPRCAGSRTCAARPRRRAPARSSSSAGRSRRSTSCAGWSAADPLREELVRHADARALRRRPPGRGARGVPRAGRAAARARPGARRGDARARAARSSSTTRRSPRRRAPPRAAPRRAPSPGGARAELARLRAALARALAGRRAGVLAAGEPGVGKTHARRRVPARGDRGRRGVAGVGQCLAQRGPGEPYMPVLEALGALARGPAGETRRRRAGRSARRPGSWSCRGCSATHAGAEAVRQRAQGSTRARMLREMLEALDAVCARARRSCSCSRTCTGPTTPRSTCVAALLRRREPARLLLLGTLPPPRASRRSSSWRTSSSVRGLLRGAGGRPAGAGGGRGPPRVALPVGAAARTGSPRCSRGRSGGNPLFMRNLLDHWLADGALVERAGAVELTREPAALEAGVPPTLRAHIRDQLDRLPARGRRAARRRERRRARLLRRHARRRARARPRGGRRALRRAGPAHAADRAARRRPRASRTTCTARCSTSCCRPTRARGCTRASARTSPTPTARGARRWPPSWASTSSPAATRSARCASCGWPRSARSGATPTPRASATCARRSTPRPQLDGGLRAHALGGRAAVLARPGARGDRRLVGARRPRTRCCAPARSRRGCPTTSRSSPSCSRSRRCTSCAASSRARTTWRASASSSRRAATPSTSSSPSELLACNLFHQGSFARALEYAERGVELFEHGGAPGGYTTFPATLGDNAGVSCHDWAGLALWFLGQPDSALARATRALELARDPSRAYSLATARAQMAVVHQCRREPEAALEWAEATIAAAQQLGYVYREAMGRVLRGWALAHARRRGPGRARDHRRAGGLARHRRAHGRPALPGAARRGAACARASSTAGSRAVAAALELARRERSLFYEPELHRLDGALHAAAGRAGAAEASPAARRWRARASRAPRRSSCGSRPTSRGCSPDPAAAAEARATVAAALRRLRGGLRHARPARGRGRARAVASGDHAGAGERQHEHAERDPVDDEHRRRVAREPAQQERDRRVADDERGDRREDRRARRPAPPSSPILRSSNRPESTTAGTDSRNE